MVIAITIHLLAATIWVGGMFFAYWVLRPAAGQLEPALRLALWQSVFGIFFKWVWLSVAALVSSGYWMLVTAYPQSWTSPNILLLMQIVGWLMILIFGIIFFDLFQRLKSALQDYAIAEAATQLNRIRQLVGINLLLGLMLVLAGSASRFLTWI